TAEMPGLYREGEYDLAGFVVGIAERDDVIDGTDIRVGHKIIGLASSGVHSNGYSLARKIFFEEHGFGADTHLDELGCTVGEELLKPTRIYVEPLLNIIKNFKVHGLVHITGGGFFDNIPRVLPQGCKVSIENGSWAIPPVFSYMCRQGNVSPEEMFRTFNCGIGMVAFVDDDQAEDICFQLAAMGETPFVIGEVVAKVGDEPVIEIDCEANF
ncbi:MAG: phosphoribosylformylglycinamidine cyclo-ligase, partial [Desulfobulbaceae bacterium]|nr:phosphoribosylformylglycinamidine cyclo-ligase [Desulfobulbaceae bacterium]